METPFQFTHPIWLLALPPAIWWVLWLFHKSDVHLSPFRRWATLCIRLITLCLVILALAGLQWKKPVEGMNVYFLLDRSESVPDLEKENALARLRVYSTLKETSDKAGVIVFGSQASIESTVSPLFNPKEIYAVLDEDGTDLASAIRLGTAAFPETGQKKLVILSDGNENIGKAIEAARAAASLDVSIDTLAIGQRASAETAIQRVDLPGNLKEGQTFDVKIFAESDSERRATVRLYQNDGLLGEQVLTLEPGKNLFSFPQTLNESGFYRYDVEMDVPGDSTPQNNRATGFIHIAGKPRILILSNDPQADQNLAAAIQSADLEVELRSAHRFPDTLAELQGYDSLFLSNVAAGDLGTVVMKRIQNAVRDFGMGLVCIGGDQSFAAGAYRGTALEETLPLDMELSSRKVIPKGALVLVMHGMEFNNGNQVARQIGLGVLDTLSAQDEMGVILWDGSERWLFELEAVGNKKDMAQMINGMNQGDLPSFENIISEGYKALKASTANLKHMVVFSDGDPGSPSDELMKSITDDRITVSAILIAGHAGPETMISIAERGNGRFYNVINASMLPQIFIKETAMILKSAIVEEPFQPQVSSSTELIRGIAQEEYPLLRGYVATTIKARTEVPLMTQQGDPLLAHWQYGLGRSIAFTSDASSRWATQWIDWPKYRQFWSQLANWSLRRLDTSNFNARIAIESGEGILNVEALDDEGNFRNFLNLQALVVSPSGERQSVFLEQTGPGRYESRFETREVGAYLVNLHDIEDNQVQGSQVLGTSVNYSPEYNNPGPNINLLKRISDVTSGTVLEPNDPESNPFLIDRKKTLQPVDLWPWLLRFAIILFPVDVGLRRIQLDHQDWLKLTATLHRWIFFWKPATKTTESSESLSTLLTRRDAIRGQRFPHDTVPEQRADLFEPTSSSEDFQSHSEQAESQTPSEGIKPPASPKPKDEPTTTTSRLLAAKRRAQERNKKE